MKLLSTFLFLFLFSNAFAQKVELAGAVIIGNSEMITYKIVYIIGENCIISGYSISDIGGHSETRAKITGVYNRSKNSLKFEEIGLISSKTNLSDEEFCFMKVKGSFSKKNNLYLYSGSFVSKGKSNKLICDSGTLYLTTTAESLKLEENVQKIIAKSSLPDSISTYISKKVQLFKIEEQTNTLKSGSIAEYILQTDSIKIEIYDDQEQDGDKITVLKNNTAVLTDFLTTNAVQTLKFGIGLHEKEVLFTIISTDEGTSPPNTVKLLLTNGLQRVKLIAPLKKNQMVRIRLVRKT